MTKNSNTETVSVLKKTFEQFCGYLIFLAVSITMAEIITRVFFNISIDLLFEFPVWLTIWASLLISGLLLKDNGHVSIDFLRNKLTGKTRWLLEIGLALFNIFYGAVIMWGGYLFVGQLYARKAMFPRIIAVPKWIVELAVPVGMMIFTGYAVLELVKVLRSKW